MSKYIELNRVFHPIPKDYSFDESAYDSPFAWSSREGKTWDSLTPLSRVIILAEAGAGKTEEIQQTTRRLRKEGKAAFFIRLEHLAIDFDVAFEEGDPEQFSSWLENQLIGQYLRDQRSRLGIFLLVNTKTKKWEHPETRNSLDFAELLTWLRSESEEMVDKNQQVDRVEVIGIDLTKRCDSSRTFNRGQTH
ncbi:hypothetical protein P4C99_02425 [Pontiellaceae bacterium B1224]|nr:hypothetical protein [Pontiellaceae bacterium B1224]